MSEQLAFWSLVFCRSVFFMISLCCFDLAPYMSKLYDSWKMILGHISLCNWPTASSFMEQGTSVAFLWSYSSWCKLYSPNKSMRELRNRLKSFNDFIKILEARRLAAFNYGRICCDGCFLFFCWHMPLWKRGHFVEWLYKCVNVCRPRPRLPQRIIFDQTDL